MSVVISALTLISIAPSLAVAKTDVCTHAAVNAEKAHSLPDGLLQAISLVETGRTSDGRFTAWPWTINAGGAGRYFKSKRDAERYVRKNVRLHETSIDVGCFQINAKWHGAAFKSATKLLDPAASANYAAKFLSKLRSEFGDWESAVRNYHSRNVKRGADYGEKVAEAIAVIQSRDEKSEKPLSASSSNMSTYQLGGVELAVFADRAPIVETTVLQPLISPRE